jgi:membrane protein
MAIQAVQWPALPQWRDVLVRTWKESGDDNVGLLAAGVAFYAFLAFVPLLASAVLTYGIAADAQTVAQHIQSLTQTLPKDAAGLIADQLKSMTETPTSAKGFGLIVAIALALYGASKGAGAIVTALNIAYEVKEDRGFIKTTLLALVMTVGAMLVLFLGVGAISGMAAVEALLPFSSPIVHILLQILFWAVAAAGASLAVALVYRHAPNRPDAPWRWVSPGSAAATILWLAASFGFGLYVSNFGNYNATYGSLGGVVVFLTWLYLSAFILLMGGELNSELERQQAEEAGTPRQGLGEAPEPAPAPLALPAPARAPAAVRRPRPAPRPRPQQNGSGGIGVAAALAGGLLGLQWWRGRKARRSDGGVHYGPLEIAPRVQAVNDAD